MSDIVERLRFREVDDSAESLAALESLVPRIQQLPAEDRNALRVRYATRKHLLGKAIDTRQEAELRTLEGADNWEAA